MKHVLFVCTGNTCRSPMAEGILRQIASVERLELEVQSAGVSTVDGLSASLHAQTVLREKEIEEEHRSKPVTQDLINWADLVLTMTYHHKEYIVEMYPQSMGKVYTLKEFVSNQQSLQKLQQDLEQISREIRQKRHELQSQIVNQQEDEQKAAKEAWRAEMEPQLREADELLRKINQVKRKMDIGDPYGGTEMVYRDCASEIEEAIRLLLIRINKTKEK